MIEVTPFRTEGLGDSTYLVRAGDWSILIDPQRDVDRFLEHLDGTDLRWVLETHLHNDYVSGGRSAASITGAELVLPAGAAPAFRHTPAFHCEDLNEGPVVIRPIHTPGHTPEHTSYLIMVENRPEALFSGGSLLVGSAGRSDLLGPERAETLARLQYRSVVRLMTLDDRTGLYPTHGQGSFCTASAAGGTTSTIGLERDTNMAAGHADEESFVRSHLQDLQPYPRYYARMGPINLLGPTPLPALKAEKVEPADVDPGAVIVDTRPAGDFAAGHLPGSLNIPLSSQFGVWFGWLIPHTASAYLVMSAESDVEEALVQLARIGIDGVRGVIVGPGAAASVKSRVGSVSDIPPGAQILDVRSPGERADRGPAGTIHRYLPDLLDGPPETIEPSHPVWVVCSSGYRSAIAASILRGYGFDAVAVVKGGVSDL